VTHGPHEYQVISGGHKAVFPPRARPIRRGHWARMTPDAREATPCRPQPTTPTALCGGLDTLAMPSVSAGASKAELWRGGPRRRGNVSFSAISTPRWAECGRREEKLVERRWRDGARDGRLAPRSGGLYRTVGIPIVEGLGGVPPRAPVPRGRDAAGRFVSIYGRSAADTRNAMSSTGP